MGKKITLGLSVKEIEKAKKDIKAYQKEIILKCNLLAQRLADEGVVLAKAKIIQFEASDASTGELLNSISDEPGAVLTNGARWIIYTGCGWAPFVEFGTGITGQENPHPDTSLVGWKYDINDHGQFGWFYLKDGEWHWTKGLPSRPFMYETGKDLRLSVVKLAKEVFAGA